MEITNSKTTLYVYECKMSFLDKSRIEDTEQKPTNNTALCFGS